MPGVEAYIQFFLKKELYQRRYDIELLTAKNNVERILGVTEKEKNRNRQQEAR